MIFRQDFDCSENMLTQSQQTRYPSNGVFLIRPKKAEKRVARSPKRFVMLGVMPDDFHKASRKRIKFITDPAAKMENTSFEG